MKKMRIGQMILWDMKFQARYGFYLLYGFFTVFYIVLLYVFPQSWKTNASALFVFSDPAAMGLFFMGAIILQEKSQKVNFALAVSPISALEYVISKVASLSLIAMLVAMVLAVSANCKELPRILLGTLLSSVLFTLVGVIIATKIVSLNQFLIATVPFEILIFVPAVLHLWKITPTVMCFYPANVCIDLITGKMCSWVGFFVTIVLIFLMFYIAYRCVLHMWQIEKGAKI